MQRPRVLLASLLQPPRSCSPLDAIGLRRLALASDSATAVSGVCNCPPCDCPLVDSWNCCVSGGGGAAAIAAARANAVSDTARARLCRRSLEGGGDSQPRAHRTLLFTCGPSFLPPCFRAPSCPTTSAEHEEDAAAGAPERLQCAATDSGKSRRKNTARICPVSGTGPPRVTRLKCSRRVRCSTRKYRDACCGQRLIH